MLSFLFRTDVHATDKSPDSWKADYAAEIWSSLSQIGELAAKYKVTAVLDGGDYFHVKASTRNSHSLVSKSAEIHRGYPCPIYATVGNHDVSYNNLDTLERQPLMVLFSSGVFIPLEDHTFENDGVSVRVVSFPYRLDRTLEDLRSVKKGDEDHLIAVVHALASDRGQPTPDFFGEPVFRYEDLVYENGPDLWAFGHWHKDQGVSHIAGRHFVNLGSVSRGSLLKENLTRIPKVALIEATKDSLSVGALPLKVEPASEVFDLSKKERREKEGEVISQFAEKIREEINKTSVNDISGSIESLDFAAEIKSLALEYLERARG